jgi:hypothetical protein
MLLNELFQAKTDIKVVKQTSTHFYTSSKIKKREIQFYAVENDSGMVGEWDVSFGEVQPGRKHATAMMTGSGGELEVLSMVKDSIMMLIEHYHPKAIHFTADKGDRSRAAVYERMLKRLLPAPWKFEKKDIGGDIQFSLTKS